MKRRLLALLMFCVIVCGSAVPVYAVDADAYNAADMLYDLGLFSGTGTKADGTPEFELDRAPNRHEAVTMLVRLLGKEAEAKAGTWDIPFTDVDEWAKPYVGYAYANKLTSGTSETTFSGKATVTASQYLTFVLRALGYDSSVDFRWDAAWELSDKIGLTNGEYNAKTDSFLRGDVTVVSCSALDVKQKDSSSTLADKLIAEDVFTRDAYEDAEETPAVLKPQEYPFERDVRFELDGVMLNRNLGHRFSAGTYTFTPYLRGDRFDEYEVSIEDGTGKVTKNNDGTFTVYFPCEDNLYIALWYDFTEVETVDENGEVSVSIRRTKTSLSLNTGMPKTGFALDADGTTILPDTGYGDNYSSYFVMDVYCDGVRLDDYTVTAADGAPFTARVQADGSLLLMKIGNGRGNFTVTWQGKSATFRAVMS